MWNLSLFKDFMHIYFLDPQAVVIQLMLDVLTQQTCGFTVFLAGVVRSKTVVSGCMFVLLHRGVRISTVTSIIALV